MRGSLGLIKCQINCIDYGFGQCNAVLCSLNYSLFYLFKGAKYLHVTAICFALSKVESIYVINKDIPHKNKNDFFFYLITGPKIGHTIIKNSYSNIY